MILYILKGFAGIIAFYVIVMGITYLAEYYVAYKQYKKQKEELKQLTEYTED